MHQFASFLKGVANFCEAEFAWEQEEAYSDYKIVFENELLEVRHYYPARAAEAEALRPIMLVPSVINSEKIFDLTANCSLAKELSVEFKVFIVSWKEPSASHPPLMANYTEAIAQAVDFVRQQHKVKPVVLGYCFGGTIALKAAIDHALDIQQLILLATPVAMELVPAWAYWRQMPEWMTKAYLEATPVISTEACHYYFAQLMWQEVITKFSKREFMLPDSSEWQEFIALEKWLRSGVGLSSKLVAEVAKGINWPTEINLPYDLQIIIAARDQVIPQAASNPVRGWNVMHHHSLDIGHLGLMLNGGARARLVGILQSLY